ncbi:MAG: hypothetical protein M0R37_10460 [Bacteroidales bacterium]|nr:hypothetical protein [Bacteroidales bacterium]
MTDTDNGSLARGGHWCDFCQTFHSSMSCYHPGNNGDRSTHPTVARLEADLDAANARADEWIDRCYKADERADEAEAMCEWLAYPFAQCPIAAAGRQCLCEKYMTAHREGRTITCKECRLAAAREAVTP